MLQNKKTKTFALVISVVMLGLVFLPIDFHVIGLWGHGWNSPLLGRLAYPFFHASLLHWLLNAWCFLACVFLGNVSGGKIFTAYLIASSAPAAAVPTVGFSGVCFALLGMLMWQAANKRQYNIIIGGSILLTFILCPRTVNNALHVWCYLLGVLSASPRFNKKMRPNSWTFFNRQHNNE